ncbi:hypothetical protein ACFSC9_22405 [Paenibacillus wenxiniae]|uniref:Uncharacterized protein n=1 Tax=Paenibacillus wenxiniae TaxID=1636843 RepID=A0ABW4RPS0_9BACL
MKIKIDDKKRQIIIDRYFRIGGVVVPNQYCEDCGSVIIYYDQYDNEFCPYCNKWLSAPCGDASCTYCRVRPNEPLEIKTLADTIHENIE